MMMQMLTSWMRLAGRRMTAFDVTKLETLRQGTSWMEGQQLQQPVTLSDFVLRNPQFQVGVVSAIGDL